MNRISFHINIDAEECIYIDGRPFPHSLYINWDDVVAAGECGGRREIETCSCGYAECGGLEYFDTFSGDGIVAWRTYQPWHGANYVFERKQYVEAVHQAVSELEWVHFFHGDDDHCPCSPETFGHRLPAAIAEAAKAVERLQGIPAAEASPIETLLGAICRGEPDAVNRSIAAGVDVNHIRQVPWWTDDNLVGESVLQFAVQSAPEPVRADIVRLLVEGGADVNRAKTGENCFLRRVLQTGDPAIVTYLLGRLLKTKANLLEMEEAVNSEFEQYAERFYEASREGSYEDRVSYPKSMAVAQWEDLANYAWLAPRMNLPSPRYLEAAMEVLQKIRSALRRSAAT